MTLLTTQFIHDPRRWNDTLKTLPYAHILQTWEWGEFKRATTGWQPLRLAFERDGQIVALASVGIRKVGFLRVMYAPKGPALTYEDAALAQDVIAALEALARQQRAIWLKIDPDVPAGTGVPGEADAQTDATGDALTRLLQSRGWHFSDDQVQFRNTIKIDLSVPEDTILAQMSQSTRRKVRIAEREGVTIRAASPDDLPTLYALYQTTGARDGFLIRPPAYYEQAWRDFMHAGLAHALIAEVEGQPVAHVILFHFARTCWYFYGASGDLHRDKMPNYLLQWRAMQWAKAQGYAVYDMWGAPNDFVETDPLWGVYNFKRGFRGAVVRHVGAWDYAPFPVLNSLYTQIMPRVRSLLRRGTISSHRDQPEET